MLVSFQMQLDAIFGGAEGMSAPDASPEPESQDLPVLRAKSELPPVPAEVLPDAHPDANPFFPLIMGQLPPNTYGLVELEKARLVSIVGQQAIFDYEGTFHTMGVGDDVYLGQITAVDPVDGRVQARLNKGGIIDEVELYLQTGEMFRQARGAIERAPAAR